MKFFKQSVKVNTESSLKPKINKQEIQVQSNLNTLVAIKKFKEDDSDE